MADFWAPLAVALWSTGFFLLLRVKVAQTAISEPPWIWLWGGSLVTALLWHGDRIVSVLTTTPHDSFYTLSRDHRAGLLLLSALLLAMLFWVASVKSDWIFRLHSIRRLSLIFTWVVDVVITVLLFTLLYGISTQVYYFYYRLIISGLPANLVIRLDLSSDFYLSLIQINQVNSYAEFLTALSFWTLLICLSWRYLVIMTNARSRTAAVMVGLAMGGACFAYQLGSFVAA